MNCLFYWHFCFCLIAIKLIIVHATSWKWSHTQSTEAFMLPCVGHIIVSVHYRWPVQTHRLNSTWLLLIPALIQIICLRHFPFMPKCSPCVEECRGDRLGALGLAGLIHVPKSANLLLIPAACTRLTSAAWLSYTTLVPVSVHIFIIFFYIWFTLLSAPAYISFLITVITVMATYVWVLFSPASWVKAPCSQKLDVAWKVCDTQYHETWNT